MDINTKIDSEIIDNSDLFDSPFYKQFPQTLHRLNLTDKISKDYLFPTFYGNVTQSVGIFLCSYNKAKKLMPHEKIFPVKMGGGKTLVIFSCYTYHNVNQISSYNEIAMTIPVIANPLINIPVLPMLAGSLFKKFGYYVFSMPVTSLENQIRGNKLWGLPKVTQKIELVNDDKMSICTAYEESGEKYFELKVPVNGKTTHFDESGYLYSKLDNKILKSKTCFKGNYKVIKNMGRLFGGGNLNPGHLWLGDTSSGKKINDLEIDPVPFQFRHATGVSSCFDLADPTFNNL